MLNDTLQRHSHTRGEWKEQWGSEATWKMHFLVAIASVLIKVSTRGRARGANKKAHHLSAVIIQLAISKHPHSDAMWVVVVRVASTIIYFTSNVLDSWIIKRIYVVAFREGIGKWWLVLACIFRFKCSSEISEIEFLMLKSQSSRAQIPVFRSCRID